MSRLLRHAERGGGGAGRRADQIAAVMIAAVLTAGCNPDVRDGLGPIVPVPNVEGAVVRDGTAARQLQVELRTAETAVVIADTETDHDGCYGFVEVPEGDWEIKVSGDESGDFDAVSRSFRLAGDSLRFTVPALDIDAHGAALTAPADGATHPRPNPFAWLTFSWALPQATIESARVQLYGADGASVWSSEKRLVDEIAWNGICNEGDLSGRAVTAGSYRWRVKFEFRDGTEARLPYRELTLE